MVIGWPITSYEDLDFFKSKHIHAQYDNKKLNRNRSLRAKRFSANGFSVNSVIELTKTLRHFLERHFLKRFCISSTTTQPDIKNDDQAYMQNLRTERYHIVYTSFKWSTALRHTRLCEVRLTRIMRTSHSFQAFPKIIAVSFLFDVSKTKFSYHV